MRVLLTLVSLLFLSGCANKSSVDYNSGEISAVPKSASYTNWVLDHCNNAIPIESSKLECMQHGGEIYAVNIIKPLNMDNVSIKNLETILVVQHGLYIQLKNKQRWCFDLTNSSSSLFKATGIKYIAVNYDKKLQLIIPNKLLNKDKKQLALVTSFLILANYFLPVIRALV